MLEKSNLLEKKIKNIFVHYSEMKKEYLLKII